MKVTGWLIMQPGGDRPYFCTRPPTDYEKKNGAKIFEFTLDVPGFTQVDGLIQAAAKEAL
jgi:hypothetical protein